MVYRLLISALVITLTLLPRVSVFAQSAPDFNLPLLAQSDAGGSQLWRLIFSILAGSLVKRFADEIGLAKNFQNQCFGVHAFTTANNFTSSKRIS